MKKLLSLLSILTISGTAVPTTIAASSYQKEEIIKNGYINYQQTNNSENLKRNKRDCTANAWSGALGGLYCGGEKSPEGYNKFLKVVVKYTTVAACGALGGIVSGGAAAGGTAVLCQIGADHNS
ncbi:hypothetical protein [Spiroplasma endosymbiont of Megaselia nigra]|uniref:hypothetical protein n=1 Tax=Spiroplasma endosymbiont of Megaselia nigra TaxID=2478537 RepID=UPI000F87CC05|nr:hypothetical protein [Spiroplasma endosymbiont of Megaselia nigra]RUO86173.1 hypothetical protein D9R21_04650 [Spiroplasma endosymbiont of Megaselia nigra]